MRFEIVTIFPSILDSYLQESILGRARKNGSITVRAHNLREYTLDKHGKVDDTPYGGGAGMVLQVQPIHDCVGAVKEQLAPESRTRTILFSAKGKKFTQAAARRLAKYDNLILICGRYEGVDERVAEHVADEEISIGDYVLTGGELPALVVIDAVARLLPGVLGNEESAKHESHSRRNYKEHAQYSKPRDFRGWKVPEILLGGNHKEIKQWRKEE